MSFVVALTRLTVSRAGPVFLLPLHLAQVFRARAVYLARNGSLLSLQLTALIYSTPLRDIEFFRSMFIKITMWFNINNFFWYFIYNLKLLTSTKNWFNNACSRTNYLLYFYWCFPYASNKTSQVYMSVN